MSDAQKLGFESPYVLLKLGHDLGEKLDAATTEALPQELEAQANKILEVEKDRVLLLTSADYEILDDNPLS